MDFSEDALKGIADNILMVQAEVRAGKAFKAFSLETYFGGISYVATSKLDGEAASVAEAVARRHKYRAKKDRWYVILDCVRSSRIIDGVVPICEKWVESDEMDKFAAEVGDLMNSTLAPFGSADSPPDEDQV